MAEFKDYFTNPNYIGGYNAMLSGDVRDRTQGIVYVEDDSDIWFWEKLFDVHHPKQYTFKPASRTVRGKTALRQFYAGLNAKAIIARDADYDWILPNGIDDLDNPFIIHTYAYSKESVLLNKDNLQQFFSQIYHTIRYHVDLLGFINKYSQAVFLWLCLIVHKKAILLQQIDFNTLNKYLNLLTCQFVQNDLTFDTTPIASIHHNINQLLQQDNITQQDLARAKSYLEEFDIDEANAYRFISGHALESLINELQSQLINKLKEKEIVEIKQNFVGTEISDRTKQLKAIFSTSFALNTHTRHYLCCENDEIHQKILAKISQIQPLKTE
ncbi:MULTISPECIES: DUF4435 domain-containing protein [unclassified Moraxella]|uniref:DUF4435 domain-containing protein n=1 Tax=unclassified Moraxella TaxID=2685852 RepID=UPI003AF91A18